MTEANPVVDQWLAAEHEVDRLSNVEDGPTETAVLAMLGPFRTLLRDCGLDSPDQMDGRILVVWFTGEMQKLRPGSRLPADVTQPARVGHVSECDRCGAYGYLSAAYVVPAPPSLIGLCVCLDCERTMAKHKSLSWVTRKAEADES